MKQIRWVLFLVLVAWTLWSASLTVMYIWAAGGPPTPHPETYARRANLYLVVTGVSFVAAAGLLVVNVRIGRR
jgi:hypothetical protein